MRKSIYFISDFHLGVDAKLTSSEREKTICRWFDAIKSDAAEVFLLGDVFDFWIDYKRVVPRGYTRLLGKIAELSDLGISIHYFKGNHDLWMIDYFEKELGIQIYDNPKEFIRSEKNFLIGHGDGLGPGDYGYKWMKKLFVSPVAQYLFRLLHPNIAISIASYFSKKSRESQMEIEPFHGIDGEWLIQYCEEMCSTDSNFDFMIFGHRHLPIFHELKNGKTRYINSGDWLRFQSFIKFDGERCELLFFENENSKIFP